MIEESSRTRRALQNCVGQDVTNDGIRNLLTVHVVRAPFDRLTNLTDSGITLRIRLFRCRPQTLAFFGMSGNLDTVPSDAVFLLCVRSVS